MTEARLSIYPEAASFLNDLREELERNEVANNLMLGLSSALVRNPHAYRDPFFASVIDGPRYAAALMTPPFPMLVYARGDGAHELLRPIVEHTDFQHMKVSGVNGPAETSAHAADLFRDLRGMRIRPGMQQLIYGLETIVLPDQPEGLMRKASIDDLETVRAWADQFAQEALPGEDSSRTVMATEGMLREERLYLFVHEGEAVSMAASARSTRRACCLNMVFTPKDFRRQGFATRLVALLSRQILDTGFRWCCLFTDASNPTSNAIYRKIGYRPVLEQRSYHLGDGG